MPLSARVGRRLVVHDRRARPGGRFHNDFQGLENWSAQSNILEELNRAGIQATFDRLPMREGAAFDAWGAAYHIRSKEPLYYLVRRGDEPGSVDQGLATQARQLGVEIRFDEKNEEMGGPSVLAIAPRTADVIADGYLYETDMADGNWICFNDALAPLGCT